jgi:hypothetical protein
LTEQAIALFDKCVAFHPDLVSVRSDRGVLLARLGKRTEALIDAQEVLKRDTQPRMLYQVACIYALTAKEQPDDRVEAFRLLSMALRQGFGYDLVETDSDLAALRQFPEYHKLVTGVRALRSSK